MIYSQVYDVKPLNYHFNPLSQSTQSLGGAIMPNEVVYSGKHAGICLYFARLLAPLWDGKLVEENQTPHLISRYQLLFTVNC